MKKCPYCAEDIQDAAIKCRYCGSDLTVPPPTMAASPPSTVPPAAVPADVSGAPVAAATPEAGEASAAGEVVPAEEVGAAPATPVQPQVAAAPQVGAAPVEPVGPVSFSHTGYRYVLGYGPDYYGIWSREQPAAPMARFPRTDDGWRDAWTRFSALEPNAQPVT